MRRNVAKYNRIATMIIQRKSSRKYLRGIQTEKAKMGVVFEKNYEPKEKAMDVQVRQLPMKIQPR